MYNLVLSGIAVVFGFFLLVAPDRPDTHRFLGAVAVGYGVVRGYYFARRLRALPPR